MDDVDVLGHRPERREAFTGALLAETDDATLQEIVEKAARQLSAPIALVSLVLDQIQFFKAHYGLPPDLGAARGSDRDVSFCQFVVRDEQPFEVGDAPSDPRIPQHLVREYGVRAYLGVPVRVRGIVVGSLCVLDTQPRRFSAEDRQGLAKLGTLVDERVTALAEHRHRVRSALAERASLPALSELREALAPVPESVRAGLPALSALRSFLRLSGHALEGGSTSAAAMRRSLRAAHEAADAIEAGLHEIEAAAGDCGDTLAALEQLSTPSPSTRLSEVLTAAQDLARHATRPVGGAPLPHLEADPVVHASRPLAVALLTTVLTAVAARLARRGAPGGIRMEIEARGATAELAIRAEGLADGAAEEIASELGAEVGRDPAVALRGDEGAVRVAFALAGAGAAAGR